MGARLLVTVSTDRIDLNTNALMVNKLRRNAVKLAYFDLPLFNEEQPSAAVVILSKQVLSCFVRFVMIFDTILDLFEEEGNLLNAQTADKLRLVQVTKLLLHDELHENRTSNRNVRCDW